MRFSEQTKESQKAKSPQHRISRAEDFLSTNISISPAYLPAITHPKIPALLLLHPRRTYPGYPKAPDRRRPVRPSIRIPAFPGQPEEPRRKETPSRERLPPALSLPPSVRKAAFPRSPSRYLPAREHLFVPALSREPASPFLSGSPPRFLPPIPRPSSPRQSFPLPLSPLRKNLFQLPCLFRLQPIFPLSDNIAPAFPPKYFHKSFSPRQAED